MTADEARDLFSEALEGELDAERKAAFEALLAADAELRSEYEAFVAIVRGTQRLSLEPDGEPKPDLLRGVQTKLRVRSRGRFYRDAFSTRTRAQLVLPIVLALATILLFAIAWAGFHVVELAEPPLPR